MHHDVADDIFSAELADGIASARWVAALPSTSNGDGPSQGNRGTHGFTWTASACKHPRAPQPSRSMACSPSSAAWSQCCVDNLCVVVTAAGGGRLSWPVARSAQTRKGDSARKLGRSSLQSKPTALSIVKTFGFPLRSYFDHLCFKCCFTAGPSGSFLCGDFNAPRVRPHSTLKAGRRIANYLIKGKTCKLVRSQQARRADTAVLEPKTSSTPRLNLATDHPICRTTRFQRSLEVCQKRQAPQDHGGTSLLIANFTSKFLEPRSAPRCVSTPALAENLLHPGAECRSGQNAESPSSHQHSFRIYGTATI